MGRRIVFAGALLFAAGCGSSASPGADGGSSGSSGTSGTTSSTTGASSPSLSAIAPATGPTDGGTAVRITGSHFATGASVKLGSASLASIVVVSATEIDGVTPAGAEGKVDVIVTNPDTRTGSLHQGFTYVAPSTGPSVGWCNLQFPIDPTGVSGTPLDLYGRVYVQGVTDQVGQGAGVVMQAGLTGDDGGIQWLPAAYNTDADGNTPGDHANDEFVLHLSFPAPGTAYAAFRAQVGGGAWTYCEKDGPHSAYDPTQADVVTATAPQPGDIAFCNLQFPPSLTVAPGDAFTLYGRVYEQGVTDQVGQGAGIAMQAGLGYDDGGWSWSDATYNTDAPSSPGAADINNDEYQWPSVGPAAGTYATAFRAQAGDGGWHYCELDGLHDAIDPTQLGSLISAIPPPPKVSWCDLQFPTAATGSPGAALTLFGQVYQPGVTDQVGAGAGITMEAGLGFADGGWSWSPTVFNGDRANGANDEYRWDGADPVGVGTYLTAFRAMLDGGPWTYCETDGPYDQLAPSQAGTLTVVPSAPPTVSWCNLQFPTEQRAQPNDALTVFGRVYQPGVTDQVGQGGGIFMQFGLGFDDGGFFWNDATYNVDAESFPGSGDINNDEYQFPFTAPTVGNYAMGFRAAVDGGPWTYCEVDGPHAGFATLSAAPLTVGDTVSWCNLQFPAQVTLGATGDFYGWVYQPGVTDQVGAGAGVSMEFGYGPGDGGYTWAAANWNADKDGITPGDHANDEYLSTITAPASGTYQTLFRARLTGGPWLYCEPNGPHLGIDPSDAGMMVVP